MYANILEIEIAITKIQNYKIKISLKNTNAKFN
jgi:hypothetical protein